MKNVRREIIHSKKIENRLYELHPIPIFYRKMKWKIQGKSVSWINDDYYETISIMSAKIKKVNTLGVTQVYEMQKKAQRGTRTRNLEIKSLTL